VQEWIAQQKGHFDPDANLVPRDFQTVLEKAPARFRRTGKVERRFSRRVFEETATGRLFYVDEGHPGHSAHLEVFDANRQHVGTADIKTGTVDTTKKVNGRELRF
jgi:hypothetical protein